MSDQQTIRGYRCAYHDTQGRSVFASPSGCGGHGPTWDCNIIALVDSDTPMRYVRGVGWREGVKP